MRKGAKIKTKKGCMRSGFLHIVEGEKYHHRRGGGCGFWTDIGPWVTA
jgi:hypothetical protein